MKVITAAVEGELEHAHPRETEAVAQCDHIWRDQSQILRDEWEPAQRRFRGSEEIGARTGNPASRFAVDDPAGTCQAAAKARK